MTRPEAIRAMLDAVLVIVANPAEKKSRKPGRASRAAELAAILRDGWHVSKVPMDETARAVERGGWRHSQHDSAAGHPVLG